MQYLRANTQVIVTVGPFVDVGDGFTPQTDITLAGDEAELIKHGSTAVVDISAATWAAVTSCRGYYSLTLTAAYTDTEGLLVVIVQDDSDCLPVKQEYMVLSEAAWDSLYVAKDTGYMDVNIKALGDTLQSATDLKDFADAGYDPATSKVQGVVLTDTCTTNTDVRGTDNAALASVCTEARLAELAAANLPADIDTLLARITAAVALASVCTEGRLAELDAANLPADVDTLLARVTAAVATAAALITAQNDLDLITGADGATLATSQANYAPNKIVPDAAGTAPTAAEINAEVVDALSTDTYAEPGTGAPPATTSLEEKISWLYAMFRNKTLTTAILLTLRNDADGADICKATLSDDATTFTKAEFISG